MAKRKNAGDKQGTPRAGRNGNVPPVEFQFKPGQSGNPKGRPKNFDALRAMARSIGVEDLPGTQWTRVEALMRAMLTSRNPADRKTYLEYAFGKVKEQIEHEMRGALPVQIVDYVSAIAPLAPKDEE